MQTLPKYVQNTNQVIAKLAEQSDHTWVRTQKELAQELGISQPELSLIIRNLRNLGRITYGPSLPGVRGRNHSLILTDATEITELDRTATASRESYEDTRQRALRPDEELKGSIALTQLSHSQIGAAVAQIIKDSLEATERYTKNRSELVRKIQNLSYELEKERSAKTYISQQKDQAEFKLSSLEEENFKIRGELNKLIVKLNQKQGPTHNSYALSELLSEDELRILENLAKTA